MVEAPITYYQGLDGPTSMTVINFKNHVMTFENQYIRFIALMESNEGRRYIELVKDEVVRGWDHAYNISKDYVYITTDGELDWRTASSATSSSDDALENWQNCLHEVLLRKCSLITQPLCRVITETIEL